MQRWEERVAWRIGNLLKPPERISCICFTSGPIKGPPYNPQVHQCNVRYLAVLIMPRVVCHSDTTFDKSSIWPQCIWGRRFPEANFVLFTSRKLSHFSCNFEKNSKLILLKSTWCNRRCHQYLQICYDLQLLAESSPAFGGETGRFYGETVSRCSYILSRKNRHKKLWS